MLERASLLQFAFCLDSDRDDSPRKPNQRDSGKCRDDRGKVGEIVLGVKPDAGG